MGERRMFSRVVVDSDSFLDMPLSTQALYFQLGLRADDDGFLNSPRKVARMIGAAPDDLKLLSEKGFLLPFDSGVVVITHWRIHNTIKKDRYRETQFLEEKSMLQIKPNGAYMWAGSVLDPCWNQNGSETEPQVKSSQVKSSQAKLSQVNDDDDIYTNQAVVALRDWLCGSELFRDSIDGVLNLVEAYGIDSVIDAVGKTTERSRITEIKNPLGYVLTVLTKDMEVDG